MKSEEEIETELNRYIECKDPLSLVELIRISTLEWVLE